MPSLYQNIRGALQTRAPSAAGFPAADKIAYEGRSFTPPAATAGALWVRMTLIPTSGRPADVANGKKRHAGMFQIDVFHAEAGDPGTGVIEALADAIKDVFPPGARLRLNGVTVKVDRSERATVPPRDGWLNCPVTVTWHCFSSLN